MARWGKTWVRTSLCWQCAGLLVSCCLACCSPTASAACTGVWAAGERRASRQRPFRLINSIIMCVFCSEEKATYNKVERTKTKHSWTNFLWNFVESRKGSTNSLSISCNKNEKLKYDELYRRYYQ